MKKNAGRIMLVANAVSLCLCAVTLLWVLFSGFTGWWRIASNPLTQFLYRRTVATFTKTATIADVS